MSIKAKKNILILFFVIIMAISSAADNKYIYAQNDPPTRSSETQEADQQTEKFRWPLWSVFAAYSPPIYGLGLGAEYYSSEKISWNLHVVGYRESGIGGLELQYLFNEGGYFNSGLHLYRGLAFGGYNNIYIGLPFGYKLNWLHEFILPDLYYFEIMPALSSEMKGYLLFKFGIRSSWARLIRVAF